MKRFSSVLLAVVLMLSLSVFSFASPQLIPVDKDDPAYGTDSVSSGGIVPYALVPSRGVKWLLTGRSSNVGTWTTFVGDGDVSTASGGILTYVGSTSSDWQNAFYICHDTYITTNSPYYWWNFIGRITDANGYVLQSSDFNLLGVYEINGNNFTKNLGSVVPASDNLYQWNDGFLQFSFSYDDWDVTNVYSAIYANVSNPNVVVPLSFEVEKFDVYYDEDSPSVPPYTFGGSAHVDTSAPPTPKDPNDSSQYGSAKDQVEWYNDAFGGAVDPELDDKIVAGNDMLLQQEEIEQDVIADFQQYSSQVDPANLTFPTAVLNGMSFIGTTFMSSYNNLGDISFVISLSMMIGVVLALIGRGEGALAREKANSRYERRRDENRAYYEQMRNKK